MLDLDLGGGGEIDCIHDHWMRKGFFSLLGEVSYFSVFLINFF